MPWKSYPSACIFRSNEEFLLDQIKSPSVVHKGCNTLATFQEYTSVQFCSLQTCKWSEQPPPPSLVGTLLDGIGPNKFITCCTLRMMERCGGMLLQATGSFYHLHIIQVVYTQSFLRAVSLNENPVKTGQMREQEQQVFLATSSFFLIEPTILHMKSPFPLHGLQALS